MPGATPPRNQLTGTAATQRRGRIPLCAVLLVFCLAPCVAARAQEESSASPAAEAAASAPAPETCGPRHLRRCLSDIGHDQAGLWTSPLRIRPHDALWLAPAAGVTAAAFHTDLDNSQDWGSSTSNVGRDLSNLGSGYATVGFSAGLYALGAWKHYDHLQETGRLGLESVLDAALVGEGLKIATNRQRPGRGNGKGEFWAHGWDGALHSSFPSDHTITTWALIREITMEYPRPWVEVSAYAVGTTVGVARVLSRQHFSSDVLVGGVLGYLIGGYVVHHHAAPGDSQAFDLEPLASPAGRAYGMRIALEPRALLGFSPSSFLHASECRILRP